MTEQQEWPAVAEAAANWSALDPENIEAVYFLALGLFGERNINGAEIAATKVAASKEARRFPQARHLLGAIYTMRGEYEAAAREFRALAELEPEGSLASAARALLDEWVREGKISSGGAVPRPNPPVEAPAG
jgi:cytochrome c-type biogenesis protein CcmH/NrfG